MINLEKDYIDLAKVFAETNSYSDFARWTCWSTSSGARVEMKTGYEGFANSDEVTGLVVEAIGRREVTPVVRTLTYHWVFETIDADEAPAVHEITEFMNNIEWLLTSRWYMKETATEHTTLIEHVDGRAAPGGCRACDETETAE
jgi:hypothetical protein